MTYNLKQVIILNIIEMNRLYVKYGNYAEVGRKMERSGTTVKKFVEMQGVPQALRIAVQKFNCTTKIITIIPRQIIVGIF